MARRTKIVATLGPASSSPEVIGGLIDAGVDVVRLNCSHGKVAEHARVAMLAREVAALRGKEIAVIADLPGPKIRTTDMGAGFTFVDDSIIELSTGTDPSADGHIYTDYPTCSEDLKAGDAITLGDGGVDLRVTDVQGGVVKAVVLNGGMLRGRPGLHMPSERVTLTVPTDEDRKLIEELVLKSDIDFVGVSFVRTPDEVEEVQRILADSPCRVIAKIETPLALDNLEEIVEIADAVMVARGDLGTECPFEDVPVYQKRIIRTCMAHATPVITATQMMESMITAATPTRAEASDVANAVCDGTDAIMLSGETAVGAHPVLVVESMAKIAEAAEIVADFDRYARMIGPERRVDAISAALTHGAWYAMNDARVSAVLCCTRSGATARAMAALRPDAKLVALSTSENTVRQESLTWGVHPIALPRTTHSDEMVAAAVTQAKEVGAVQKGDTVAVLSGMADVPGATDSLRLITVD